MIGGTVTGASVTEWALEELLRQPALLEQAVQELDQVVGSARAVAESDVPNLPYLQAVVKETLRLYPPGPLLAPHYSTQATTLAGYDIPAGTTVIVNAWAVGRDPGFWENPHEFRPHRFLHHPDSTAARYVVVHSMSSFMPASIDTSVLPKVWREVVTSFAVINA